MSDVTCPYCGAAQEINHDDGYGYEEDIDHEQDCTECSKTFKFTTSISFNYEAICQDGDHDMQPFGEKWTDMYACKNCNYCEKRIAKDK